VDKELLDYVRELSPEMVSYVKRRRELSASTLAESAAPGFSAGDRVLHSVFGEGTVTGLDEEHRCYKIRFDRLPTERTISYRVKLKKAEEM